MNKKTFAIGAASLLVAVSLGSIWIMWGRPAPDPARGTSSEPTIVPKERIAPKIAEVDLVELGGIDKMLVRRIEHLADQKMNEPVVTAKILTAVLIKHGIPVSDRLRELDETGLPPLRSEEDWCEFVRRVLSDPDGSGTVPQYPRTKRAFDLFVDFQLAVAEKCPAVSARFTVADGLSQLAKPADPDALAVLRPTAKQIAAAFKGAFDGLISKVETRPKHDLALMLLINRPDLKYYFAVAEDSELSEADLIALLHSEQRRIVDGTRTCLLTATAPDQKAVLRRFDEYFSKEPIDYAELSAKLFTANKQVTPVLQSFVRAVNVNDIKTYCRLSCVSMEGLPPELDEPLVKQFGEHPDTVSLEFRCADATEFCFLRKGIIDWNRIRVCIYFFEVTADSRKHPRRLDIVMEKRNGSWVIAECS